MAPEQITTGSVTRRTDVYAAAVVFWEMLTGRRLFRADNEAKLLALVLDSEVLTPSKLVEGLPSGFDQVVMKGLDRDPAKRYATAREMAIDVEAVVGIEPPTEVGEWVEIVAADELRERANRIEEIERSVLGSSPSGVSHAWSESAPAFGVRRPDEPSTVQQGGRGAGALPPVPRPPPLPASLKLPPPGTASLPPTPRPVSQASQVSNIAVAHTDAPRALAKRPVSILVAAALAACAIGATLMALRPLRSNAVASISAVSPPPASAGPPLASEAPPPASVSMEPAGGTRAVPAGAMAQAPRPTIHGPAPSAAASSPAPGHVDGPYMTAPVTQRVAPKPPIASAPPVAAAVNATPPSPAAAPTPLSPRPSPPPAPKAAAPLVDCTPPYTTDDKGHIHFKPACVN